MYMYKTGVKQQVCYAFHQWPLINPSRTPLTMKQRIKLHGQCVYCETAETEKANDTDQSGVK
ncbi:hypothetical protein E2C01_017838 [Portunus trituberculatus]|uniref:Uncharacterized protein n=1 Tax=Portunus trituberculatus TaxID=210409 RepID=A0A5B7DUW6_PORTR|nr:hypothetical protein [Portunus trituberculatus]